jgi:hypothetical protein
MILNITFTAQDYIEASKMTISKNWASEIMSAINAIFILVITVLLFAPPQTEIQSLTEVSFFLFVLSLCFTPYIIRKLYMRSTNKKFKKSSLNKPSVYEITDEGIKIKKENSNTEMSWGAFERAQYTETLMVWFSTPISLFIFPKHSMSEENWNELLKITKARIENVTGIEPQAPQERR